MGFPGKLFDLAQRYHKTGDLRRAERLYRQILEADPSQAHVHVYLGMTLQGTDRGQEALTCFLEAIRLNPSLADAQYRLGNALKDLGQLAEAAECYGHVLRLSPYHADAHNNLGVVQFGQKQSAEAAKSFRQVLALNSHHADAHNNLGTVLFEQRQIAKAQECFRQALRAEPNHSEAQLNLGNSLFEQGKLDEAAACFRQVLQRNPNHALAHYCLGNAWRDQGFLDEAIVCYQQTLRLQPHDADAFNNLGNVLKDQGRLDEAIACCRQARQLQPDKLGWHSNLLLTMLYHPRFDSQALCEELRRWEQEHALSLAPRPRNDSPDPTAAPRSSAGRGSPDPAPPPSPVAFTNDPSPERRLRIGYVSPDFRDHVLGLNVLPLLRGHDHRQFEITLYSHQAKPDALTKQFRKCADHWCDITPLSDDQAAAKIRQDGIDILVDLTLHTAGNRLLIFARKPAPVQVTFAGYPGSTGLQTIDYRLTDPYLDPPGLFDPWYAERSFRLPHSFWCYDPHSDRLEVGPLPALKNGFVTFGCLNAFTKINDDVLDLWAQVLRAVPASRLMLLAQHGSHRRRTLEFLAQRGIAPERVTFCSRQPRLGYLALYQRVDIGLDTFPYNGHTTSLDSFWMGVPVITLVGNRVVGRAGLSQLTNLGLEQLAATNPDDFVRLAVELAGNLSRLKALRMSLRDRMTQSPLMDAKGFTKGIEEAYRTMWRTWCRQQPGKQKRFDKVFNPLPAFPGEGMHPAAPQG